MQTSLEKRKYNTPLKEIRRLFLLRNSKFGFLRDL